MAGRKKILIIGENMLDKTIFVSNLVDNIRSCKTYKKKDSHEFTFGGVFFISRYLQHFQDIDITVLNINPKITGDIKDKYEIFCKKFVGFSKNDTPSAFIDIEGSRDYIHSITRFITDITGDNENADDTVNWKIRFQIEDYYAPDNRCVSSNKKRYTYPTTQKSKLWNEIRAEIDNWLKDNAKYDRRILLMDYGLGLFDKELGLLSDLESYFNKKNDYPVIIYSDKDYIKFKSFQNSHIVTYSPDVYDNIPIDIMALYDNIKMQEHCFRSLALVSARYTVVGVFPSTKSGNDMKPPKRVETKAYGCTDHNLRHVPRLGHKAIVAAHLAMALATDENSLLNKSWLEYAHDCSKEIASEILTENIIYRDWKKDIEKRKDTKTSKPELPNE